MKKITARFPIVLIAAFLLMATGYPSQALAQTDTPPAPNVRALVVITSYDTGGNKVTPGTDFTLYIRFQNQGDSDVYNMLINFEGMEILPLGSGGMMAVPFLDTGASIQLEQAFRANAILWGAVSGTIVANVNYSDERGNTYTEKFTLTIDLNPPVYGTPKPSVTPTLQARSQLVVAGYKADVDPLEPGTIFNLSVDVRNLGDVDANNVTMVLGGGVISASNPDGGTPNNSGITASGADLSVFAPLGTSNLIYIDKVPVGSTVKAGAQLIVNVSSNPGAYPFKISFTYLNSKGERIVEDQVITLLVYSLPKLEINFYLDPGRLTMGMPMPLPIQITNLGKNTAVLGTLLVTSLNADLSENRQLVGSLEGGGYFSMDPLVIPYQEGELELLVSVSYTDDFNQPRKVETVLKIMVDPAPIFDPMPGEDMDGANMPPVDAPETFFQKVIRFFKGLLGLGSGKSQPADQMMPGDMLEGDQYFEESAPMPVGPKG